MTAHILEAALFIKLMRGQPAAARTLIERQIDFDTMYRVLARPELRRRATTRRAG